MKLKTNKNYIKGSRKNIRNQNNKDQIEKKYTSQIKIEEWIWKQIKIIQKFQEKILEIKRIKTKLKKIYTTN